jgi:hypothetical protein
MATTFSSNIGSSSKGGFSAYAVTTDDYVSAFFANMTTGEVINSTDGEEQYATTLSANQLAALSTNLKGLLAAAVASGADPTANPLAYLRKLVGFVALDDGQTFTYTTSTYTVDGVDYEEFYIELTNQPGTVMMYIPNSAAAGLFTGSGSDNTSLPAPVIPTNQRADAVANVPGIPLAGAVCMAIPNAAGAPTITLSNTASAGYAKTGATLATDFIVEKINMSAADPGPGLGTLMFAFRFAAGGAAGNQRASTTSVAPGDLTVPAGWLYRVVCPVPADATLADVALTIAGTVALP